MINITLSEEEIESINDSDMANDRFVILPKQRNKILGIYPCMLLQYLLFKYNHFKEKKQLTEDGFFFNTKQDIEEETNLTKEKQDTALEKLINLGLVTTKLAGQPAKKYYKINSLAIFSLFHQDVKTCKSCCSESRQLDVVNHAITNKQDNNSLKCTSYNTLLRKKLIVKQGSKEVLPKAKIIKAGIKVTLADNSEERKEKEKEKLHREVTFDMQKIIDCWISNDLSFHTEGTKTYAKAIDNLKLLLQGKLFNTFADKSNHNRKFSFEEIKRSINNFVMAAYNLDYEPANKTFLQKVNFVNFFYSLFPCPREEDKSLFLKYLLGKPAFIKDSKIYTAKDDHPEATKILVDWYKKTFGNRDSAFSLKNKNDLVYAVKEIEKFYEANKDKLKIEDRKRIYNQYDPICFLALQLTRAMDKMLRENESMFLIFNTSWLKTEKTLKERLPTFLQSENMI